MDGLGSPTDNPLAWGVLSAWAEEDFDCPPDPVEDLDRVILPQDLTRAVSAVAETASDDRSTDEHDDDLH